MNKNRDQLKIELLSIIAAQESEYLAVDQILSQANESLATGNETHHHLSQMKSRLENVAQREAELKSIREAWQENDYPASAEVDEKIKNLTAVVQRLLASSKTLEDRLQSAAQRLRPEISQSVAASQMHRAYWKAPTIES